MKPIKLVIKTNSEQYPIFIGRNLINNLPIYLKNYLSPSNKFLLIIDKKVPKKFISVIEKSLKKIKIYKFFFNANERNKNQESVNKILKVLLDKNFSRQDCLVSIGGGITGDVSGFAASLFKRGLQFVNIPSTLLSQVDSSIGGKTGINTIHGKNLIGTFYQPKLVLSDTNFLKSLPKREIVCGYGEIFKHSLIRNKNFFKYLNKNFSKILDLESPYIEKTIFESCNIKKDIVEKDEKETGLRKILNFGHTFAHSYEAALNYSKRLNHGEAVILGIITALKFSLQKNYIKKSEYDFIVSHIKKTKISLNIRKYFSIKDLSKILFFMTKDKKNSSKKINLILLKRIGSKVFSKQFDLNNLKIFMKKELSNNYLN
tara:strand:- start:33 stop:1151 length:1119 start_codon:yes stop_codon:yes gene_type:complete